MQAKNASKIYNLGYKIGIMGSGSRFRVQGSGFKVVAFHPDSEARATGNIANSGYSERQP